MRETVLDPAVLARKVVANVDEPDDVPASGRRQVRAIFISDLHMGTKGCKAEAVADFLKLYDCEFLYLVGDIIDGWRLRKSWYWDHQHDRIIRRVIKKAKRGTRVVYIPGNHDEWLRDWIHPGFELAGVHFELETEHVTADGRRLLITHGDEFDSVVRHAKALALLGDRAYEFALVVNRWFNVVRRRLGYPYWSLSQWLKHQVKSAVAHIDRFEAELAAKAQALGFDGVVCGHIHTAAMRTVNGILYLNDGDWVESCTALVEHLDGRLEIISGLPVGDVLQLEVGTTNAVQAA
ncbi:MAG: UDP-2,3-diacylglucosamine diphosphatase [Rhodopila sp.]